VNPHLSRPRPLDAYAQRGKRRERRQAVLALEESVDLGNTYRDRAEHRGAM
jgi:hypothetical protein